MKCVLFVVIGTMAASSMAFAETYNCGELKNHGIGIVGGPSYAIDTFGDSDVILAVTTGGGVDGPHSTVEYNMNKTSSEVESSTYEAAGITAVLGVSTAGGRHESVTISMEQEGKTYSSSCKAETTTLDRSDAPTIAPEVTQWHDGTTGLSITGGGAQLQFSCGYISIAEWHADGKIMQGFNHMGPISVGPGLETNVTASLRNGKLYVRTGVQSDDGGTKSNKASYVLTPGNTGPHEICL